MVPGTGDGVVSGRALRFKRDRRAVANLCVVPLIDHVVEKVRVELRYDTPTDVCDECPPEESVPSARQVTHGHMLHGGAVVILSTHAAWRRRLRTRRRPRGLRGAKEGLGLVRIRHAFAGSVVLLQGKLCDKETGIIAWGAASTVPSNSIPPNLFYSHELKR